MDELRLDGNAAAGPLGEVFSFEVTTAQYACGGCGGAGMLGGTTGYAGREMGVLRCPPSCNNTLFRLHYSRGRPMGDLRGARYLITG